MRPPPAARAGRAGQELEVRARVGLHRARDVAQQHDPPADDRAGGGGPAGSGRRRCAGCRAASGAGRSARRGGRAGPGACAAAAVATREPRHQPVQPAPARRARARRSAWCAAAPRRWPAPARAPRRGVGSRSAGAAMGAAPGRRRDLCRPRRVRARSPRLAPRVARARLRVLGDDGSSRRRVADAEHADRTPRRTPAPASGSDTNTARAVQYRRRRETGSTDRQSAARTRPRARSLTGRPASCSRRLNAPATRGQVEPERSGPGRRSHRRAHQLLEARGADHLLVLGVLEHRAERPVDRVDVELARRRARPAPPPSRSPRRLPGGFCTSLSRIRATASATWTASVSEAPRTRRRTISTSRCGVG